MENRATTNSHDIAEATTGAVIVIRGKILECTVVDESSYQRDLSGAFCACGSGGGCGSYGYRRRKAVST